MTSRINWKSHGVRRKDERAVAELIQSTAPRYPVITHNVEIIGVLEEIVSILKRWPEAAAMFAGLVRSSTNTLEYARSGGRLQYAREKSFEGSLAMLQICLKKGELPDPAKMPAKKPRARYVRAPLASFLIDPSSLPKAPPGKKL